MDLGAPQRKHDLRAVFNALRWVVRTGAPWRYMPREFPARHVVYEQTQRWIAAGCFEQIVHDLRGILRIKEDRQRNPTAIILDSRTAQSTPESGHRAGYDGAKRKRGTKIHIAVDTLGNLLAAHVTPATEQDRAQVDVLISEVQKVTDSTVTHAFVDQGYSGADPAAVAAEQGVTLEVINLTEVRKGFILLPRRWVVERSFAWSSRFRRLSRDYERLPETFRGIHFIVFSVLMLSKAVEFLPQVPNTL